MELRHPGDARDLKLIAKPPTSSGAEITKVRDLVVIPTSTRPWDPSDPPEAGTRRSIWDSA